VFVRYHGVVVLSHKFVESGSGRTVKPASGTAEVPWRRSQLGLNSSIRPLAELVLQTRPRRLGSRLASPRRFKPILGNRGGTGRLGGRCLYSGQFSAVSGDSVIRIAVRWLNVRSPLLAN
jgi:hypothetical protein